MNGQYESYAEAAIRSGICQACESDHGANTICPHCGYGTPCGHHYLCATRDPRYLKRMEGVP